MAPRLVLLVAFVSTAALAACHATPERPARIARADSDSARTAAEAPGGWTVNLAPPGEPGERVVMYGRVIDQGRVPVGGVRMEFYHADSAGLYAKGPNDPPRLAGRLRTSSDGRYEVHTVLPGGYDGYTGHVHVTIHGPRGGPQHLTVDVPSRVPPRQARRATKPPDSIDWLTPPPHVDLVRDSSGVLRLYHDFRVTR